MPMQNVSVHVDQKPEITSSFLAIVMNMFKRRRENLLLKNKIGTVDGEKYNPGQKQSRKPPLKVARDSVNTP